MIHNEYVLFLPKTYFYLSKKIPKMTSCFITNYDTLLLKNALEDYHITLIQSEKMNEFLSFIACEAIFVDPKNHGGGLHQGKKNSFLDMHADFNYHPINKWWFFTNVIKALG